MSKGKRNLCLLLPLDADTGDEDGTREHVVGVSIPCWRSGGCYGFLIWGTRRALYLYFYLGAEGWDELDIGLECRRIHGRHETV